MQAGWAGQAGVGATWAWDSPGKNTGVALRGGDLSVIEDRHPEKKADHPAPGGRVGQRTG